MFLVFEAEFWSSEFWDSPQMRGLNRGTPVKSDSFNQYAMITWKWCKIAYKFLVFTNKKFHSGF